MHASPEISKIVVDPTAYRDGRIEAIFSKLRQEAPLAVIKADGFDPFWAVTRYEDILEVERRAEEFTNDGMPVVLTDEAAVKQGPNATGVRTLIQMDGPEHRAFRQLTQSWFMPQNLKKLEGRVREIARKSIDRMEELGGECDFARDIALFFPLRIIMEILGIPEKDEPMMLRLTQEMFGSQDEEFNRGAADTKTKSSDNIKAVVADLVGYFMAIFEDRKKNPRDDVSSVVANGLVDGREIGFAEAMGYYVITATAGHDTTSNTLAASMVTAAKRPDIVDALKADPSLIPAFIEESVRLASPVRHFMRTASRDTELAGQKISKGDWLMLCFSSGNRDIGAFKSPDEFDLQRNPNRHVAFGAGPHMCIGQHLARLELKIFWEELLKRVESIELAGEPILTAATFVGGPKNVPIRYKLK